MKPKKLALFVNSILLFALAVSPYASPALAEAQATFTVNASSDVVDVTPGDGVCETAAGNGMCTLRAAIMEANVHVGADTIQLPAATYVLTIPGASEDLCATGDLDITESLTITGAGPDDTIIDADGLNDRVFEIMAIADAVTISRLKIKNGFVGSNGGGINTKSDLTLEEIDLFNNEVTGYGGGVYSNSGLSLKNVRLSGNTASLGGGIFTIYDLLAEDSLLVGNSATNDGGGLYAITGAHVQMTRTDFQTNTAEDVGGNIYSSGELEMDEGTITQGDATNTGGGLYLEEGSKATLTNVAITSNHAASAGGVMIAAGADFTGSYLLFDLNSADNMGGAINNEDGSLTLVYSTLSNNSASSGGAISTFFGVSDITGSTLVSNTATTYGGGIYLTGVMRIKRSTLNANHANAGGGILNGIGDLWIENSTISGNHATTDGGGIANGFNTNIFNSTIIGNLAGDDLLHPGGVGGGVFDPLNLTFFRNTILAGNYRRLLLNLIPDDCYGKLESGDYNLVGTLDDCTLVGLIQHVQIGEDPLLGELADNSGRTHTHALLEGSPAIDGGNPEGCLGIDDAGIYHDQRGENRHLDGDKDGTARCDIGSFELATYVTMYLPLLVK